MAKSARSGEHLGEMQDPRFELAALDALLKLPVAAGVDDHDDVEISRGDLIEVAVEDTSAVVGPHDRIGAGRAAARGRARQLDVFAEARDQLAGLAPHAQPVAQMA